MKVSNRITRLVTAGLIAGALAAPTASAVPAGPDAPNSGEPVVLESAPAIGAGAAGGLLLLFGVGGATYRHRQGHADVAH
jgi:hypothetical protein